MYKSIISFAFLLASVTAFADSELEKFFKGIEGKWFGEVPGIYKIDIEVSAFNKKQPWLLQTGTIKIDEGEAEELKFELSENQSLLDEDTVYFLKVKSKENEVKVYTFTGRGKESLPFSFWRHLTFKASQEVVTTSDALKWSIEDNNLVLGFVSGRAYCTKEDETRYCATDGYRPFRAQRILDKNLKRKNL